MGRDDITVLPPRRCPGVARGAGPLARREVELGGLADALVAEVGVEPVRSRVREVGVEEAEALARVETRLRDCGDERARIAMTLLLRRGVHGADARAVRCRAAEPGHRDRLAAVLPEHEARV